MKLSALSKRIIICYVGPDDCGIWKRTLNSELKTLFESLHDAQLIDLPHITQQSEIQKDNPCCEKPCSDPPRLNETLLDEVERAVTSQLDLEDEIKAADLVAVYLTRSNLHQCNWAIGFAQGAGKKVVVLDGMYCNEANHRYNYSHQDFSYEAVAADKNHPDAATLSLAWPKSMQDRPIQYSAQKIASFILQNTKLFRVPMIPRGKWIMVSLRSFWQSVVESSWDDPEKLEKLKSVLVIYGAPDFMFTAEGWGQPLTNPLGVEYKDEQSYKDLGDLMTRCHPWIGRIGTHRANSKLSRGNGIAHVWPDESGIRQMSVHGSMTFET
jgi:hypothetical protein